MGNTDYKILKILFWFTLLGLGIVFFKWILIAAVVLGIIYWLKK